MLGRLEIGKVLKTFEMLKLMVTRTTSFKESRAQTSSDTAEIDLKRELKKGDPLGSVVG